MVKLSEDPGTNGRLLFLVMLGATLVLLGQELASVSDWSATTTPAFVGKALFHVGTVIGSFYAGKQIPTEQPGGGLVDDGKD